MIARRHGGGQLGLTAVLLAGVPTLTYGYLHRSRMALYAGLLLTLGGVVKGVIRIVTQDGE